MSGNIKFSVIDTTLQVSIQSSSPLLADTVTPISISLYNKAPLDVLKELESMLSYYFVFEDRKPLDKVVENMINNLGPRKIDWKSISTIKIYAKYFYQIWLNKDKTGLTNNDQDYNRQTASIIIDILSWWYTRRLVHIYVICVILEAVHGNTQSQAQAPVLNMNINMNNTATTSHVIPTYAPVPTPYFTPNTDVETLKTRYESNVPDFDANKAQLQADVNKLLKEYEILQTEYQGIYTNALTKDKIIADLEKKMKELKELLLHSTTMIFKIEEIPILTNALKS
jgi:hypothetical protein